MELATRLEEASRVAMATGGVGLRLRVRGGGAAIRGHRRAAEGAFTSGCARAAHGAARYSSPSNSSSSTSTASGRGTTAAGPGGRSGTCQPPCPAKPYPQVRSRASEARQPTCCPRLPLRVQPLCSSFWGDVRGLHLAAVDQAHLRRRGPAAVRPIVRLRGGARSPARASSCPCDRMPLMWHKHGTQSAMGTAPHPGIVHQSSPEGMVRLARRPLHAHPLPEGIPIRRPLQGHARLAQRPAALLRPAVLAVADALVQEQRDDLLGGHSPAAGQHSSSKRQVSKRGGGGRAPQGATEFSAAAAGGDMLQCNTGGDEEPRAARAAYRGGRQTRAPHGARAP